MGTITVKHRNGLAPKLIIGIIVMTVLVSVFSIIVGANIYWNDIVTIYNNKANEVAAAAQDVYTEQELRSYADLVVRYAKGKATEEELNAVGESDRFKEQCRLIESLRSNLKLSDIYIAVYDIEIADTYTDETYESYEWKPLIYILDCYYDKDKAYPFGSASRITKANKDILRTRWVAAEQTHSDKVIITNYNGLWIITGSNLVIYNNETVAMIGVEVAIPTLESDMNNFIWSIVRIDLTVLGALILISVILLVFGIIRPIKTVTNEAEKFVSDNANVSEVLGKIRTHDEIHTLSESLLSLEYGINEYIRNITKITAEKERISAELGIAAKIQAEMLPKDFPKNDNIELFAAMTPAKEVGGDFYDFFFVDDCHLALIMADVSGKGVPAALFSVVAKAVLRDKVKLGGDPATILYDVNNILCQDNGAGLFITVWLGILDLKTGIVQYVNAGHEYPVVSGQGNAVKVVEKENCPPLAAMEDTGFVVETIKLESGDSLFLYTDGVPEAKAPDGSRFSMNKLIEILERDKGMAPEQLVNDLKQEVDSFQTENDPFDDVTIMNVVWKGKV